jgi:adenylyl-sulfate kinase
MVTAKSRAGARVWVFHPQHTATVDVGVKVTTPDRHINREQRWSLLGARGGTVWFTGLPGAGKTTIASALEQHLLERGRSAYLLDGDHLRRGICSDLGFSRVDRDRNVKRVGEIARLLADSGTVAVVALVSPYEATRRTVRQLHLAEGLPFLEVFVNTPLAVCAQRDPKGMYARANAGELRNFTGIDAPYEPPRCPDVELSPGVSVAESVATVMGALGSRR